MKTSDALGVAASQLGPDAQAAVVELNKLRGLSHEKVTRYLESLLGIRLSRGGGVHTVVQFVLMSVWRTCWQQGRSALDYLSQLLRGQASGPGLAPVTDCENSRASRTGQVLSHSVTSSSSCHPRPAPPP